MSEHPEFLFDIEQSTPEWLELRRGIPTASEFKTILANGKARASYMRKLAGEQLSEQPMETFQNAAMLRGKEMEAEARDHFARANLLDMQLCGFVRRKLKSGRFTGCSPDSLFSASKTKTDTVLEIKTMRPDLMIEQRENGYDPHRLPSEHLAQCMGALWITGYPRVELIVYYRGMPYTLHYSINRDNAYIAELEAAVERFDNELAALVKRHRSYK